MKNKELKDFVYNNVYQNSANGYVLTPSELAFEMTQTLPELVFDSDNKTFLDPICKSGTFLFEIVERLYQKGHSISNIQSRVFTVDSNFHSLNVAQSTIKKILNKESGAFKLDFQNDWIERYYNRLIYTISEGKFSTLEAFLDIIIMNKEDLTIMNEFKINISKFIEQYEKVSKLESKLFGEVFTPRKLIDEMLDTLPTEIWKKKDLKWLDPAVGIGNFPAAIVDRLMVGLEEEFPNESERRKWILEEMLYMCDISTKNLFLLYMLFDKNNEFKLNVYRGSFLTEDFDKHMKNVWKLDGFDVIVGNPPYQDNNDDGSRKSKRSNLWSKFITRSFLLMINEGYLCFITPNAWMSPTNPLNKSIFLTKQLIYLNVNECSKYFNGVGSAFSYYTIQNTSKYKETSVICKYKNKIHKSLLEIKDSYLCIPELISYDTFSIFEKTIFSDNQKFDVRIDSQFHSQNKAHLISKNQDKTFKFKIIHTPSQIMYSSIEHRLSGTWRVFIPKTTSYEQIIVDKCGNTQNVLYIITDSEEQASFYKSILLSKLYRFIANTTRWSNFNTDFIIKSLPFPNNLKKDFTNKEIYEYFNLNQEEIDLIESTIKD